MMIEDKNALICDLAETYGIYDYRQLPARLIAAFSVGLRENSRIKQKLNESPADDMTIFLASITDRLGLILTALTGVEKPPSIVEHILGTEATKNGHVLSFESPEEFIKQRYGGG